MPETRRYTREEIEEYIRVGRLHDWGRANAMLRQLLADNAAMRVECRAWREWFANRDEEGFVPMANVKSRLDAIAATDAAGAMEDK